jgi:DNA-binding CsgD family transcriptional regulator/PAS domain-containing protein
MMKPHMAQSADYQLRMEAAIDAIYDAGANPALWKLALDHVMRLMESIDCVLSVWNAKDLHSNVLTTGGNVFGVGSIKLYHEHYSTIEPTRLIGARLPPNTIMLCHEHIDSETVRKSEYYADFFLPHGARWLMGAHLTQRDTTTIDIAFQRSPAQPHFSEVERKRLADVVPHLRRAVRLGQTLARTNFLPQLGLAAFDRIPAALAIIDEKAHLLYANPSAEAIFRSQDGLSIRNSALHIEQAVQADALRYALSVSPERAASGASLHVNRRSNPLPYLLRITPLRMPENPILSPDVNIVLLTISVPGERMLADRELLIGGFGLTPAEARVAAALAAGDRAEHIAARFSISMPTVRSQIRAVLEKTHTRRQIDAVQVIAATLRGNPAENITA